MANDFDEVLNNVLPQLASTDSSKRAAASAAVAMLLTQAPEGMHLSSRVLPAVVPLLSSDSSLVQVIASSSCSDAAASRAPVTHRSTRLQRNACAALIAVAEADAEHLHADMKGWTEAVG